MPDCIYVSISTANNLICFLGVLELLAILGTVGAMLSNRGDKILLVLFWLMWSIGIPVVYLLLIIPGNCINTLIIP